MYDLANGQLLRTIKHPNPQTFAISPNGRYVALGSGPSGNFEAGCEYEVRVTDVGDGTLLGSAKYSGAGVVGLVFTPNNEPLVALREKVKTKEESVAVKSLLTNKDFLTRLKAIDSNRITWTPDFGQMVALGEGWIRLFDPVSGRMIREVGGPKGKTYITLSRDRKWFLIGGSRNYGLRGGAGGFEVHSLASGGWLRTIVPESPASTPIFLPDSRHIAAGCGDGAIHIWDSTTGKEVQKLKLEEGKYGAFVALSPDGKFLVAAGGKTLQVYDLTKWTRFPLPE